MFPHERIVAMIEKARRDILPTLDGPPESIRRGFLRIKMEFMEANDFMTLEEYLSQKPNLYPNSKGNPDFYSAIPYQESFDFFKRFKIKQNPSSGHFVGQLGTLYNTSIEARKKGQWIPEDYERMFNLPEGTFTTRLATGTGWRLDDMGDFSEYWGLILDRKVPFFLDAVRVSHNPDKLIYIVSNIDI